MIWAGVLAGLGAGSMILAWQLGNAAHIFALVLAELGGCLMAIGIILQFSASASAIVILLCYCTVWLVVGWIALVAWAIT